MVPGWPVRRLAIASSCKSSTDVPSTETNMSCRAICPSGLQVVIKLKNIVRDLNCSNNRRLASRRDKTSQERLGLAPRIGNNLSTASCGSPFQQLRDKQIFFFFQACPSYANTTLQKSKLKTLSSELAVADLSFLWTNLICWSRRSRGIVPCCIFCPGSCPKANPLRSK